MKQNSKKLLSLLLACVMCLSLLPTAAFAEAPAETPPAPVEEILQKSPEAVAPRGAATNIAVARSGNEGDIVSTTGTVTFTDGRNVTIQDATGGIGIDFGKDDALGKALVLKDTVTVTGTLGNYSKLVQIKTLTVKTKGNPAEKLPDPVVKTITEALAGLPALESQRIKITGLTLGATDSKGNTPATKDGKTIVLYRMPDLAATIYENCVVDVTAILSRYNDMVQLRIADPADVDLVTEPTVVNAPVPAVATGSAVELNQKIAVTCSTPGAKVQFSITAEAEKLWADLPVDGLAMPATKGEYEVYLKAVKDGKTDSPVVTLTYPVGMVEEMTIRQARGVAKDAEVFFTGRVIGDNGKYGFFVQDGTAGILVDKKLSVYSGLKIGDNVEVHGTITGPDPKSGLLEVAPTAVTFTAGEANTLVPIPVTPAMVNTGLYESRLVSLSQVKLLKAAKTGTQNHKLEKNGVEITYRANIDSVADQALVNVVGIASIYNTPQILPAQSAKNTGITGATPDGSTTGDPIAEFLLWNAPSMGNDDPIPSDWPANGGIAQVDAKLTVGGGAALKKNTGAGYGSTKWNNGVGTKYWQAVLSTKGLSDITVSATHASSGTGPSALHLQYSIDATNFKNVPGGYVPILPVKSGSSTYYNGVTDKIPLPADANNLAKVTLRWVLDAAGSAKVPETPVGSGGSNQINSIIIAGNEFFGPDAVAPVKTDPAAGTVPAGTQITLATSTADATIYYTTDGSEPTTSSTPYTGPITISDFSTTPFVIKTFAKKDENTCPVKTYSYTQAQVAPVICNKLDGSKITPAVDMITFSAKKDVTISYVLTTNVGGTEVVGASTAYTAPIQLTAEQFPVKFVVTGARENYKSSEITLNFTLGSTGVLKNYFGQLHSHTAENSDGSGTLDEAFNYAANQSGVDFLAVTDHSNSFDKAEKTDTAETYNLGDYNKNNQQWVNGHTAADKYTNGKFIGMYGYEMTWSGGPGHINTFATPGFVSRNNSELNSKSGDKGMRAYYALLSRPEEASAKSISQFNHPGTTFGNFSNFGYYDPIIDSRISLVEVGNGEGAIGSGGYFPSYSEYTLALDKGWHLAPTNNQDNHKQKWGNANTARSVIYTNDFSRDGLYQAMRDMRVYATEDENLNIVYTLNDAVMGTVLPVVPDKANFSITIDDPDGKDTIKSVKIISTGGREAYTFPTPAEGTLTYEMAAPAAGYYYIRVQEADLDIAVTAPIWLGAAKAVGISELTTDAFMVVQNEKIDLALNAFNNEESDAILNSIVFTDNGVKNESLSTTTPATITSATTLARSFRYTPTTVGKHVIKVTANITVDGVAKEFTATLTLDVKDPAALIYIGVDGSHFNEYVNGNYKDSMSNFGKLAAGHDVSVKILKTSSELLAAMENPKYAMMVFTAPSRRNGTELRDPYATYSDAEVAAVKAFSALGKPVVVLGWADYYEKYKAFPAADHMAAQQNKLLKAIGSTLRIADDEAKDDTNNPGSNAARLYLTDYNGFQNPLLAGVNPAQVWSQYGGATIFAVDAENKPVTTLPATVSPLISAYGTKNSDGTGTTLDAIVSSDEDKDGHGAELSGKDTLPPTYLSDHGQRPLLAATETVTQGDKSSLVVVSGAAFLSNFEIQAEVENAGTLNYSNYNFLENIVETLNPPTITTIADAAAGPAGTTYTIEGTVMSSVNNGSDTNTGFFDCIYVQDKTGGINVFPVSSGVEIGQKVRITGTRAAYAGERQLQDAKVKVLTYLPGAVPAARSITTKQAADNTYLGELVTVRGTVESIKQSNGVIESLMVKDSSGTACRVFIDGYITKGKTIPGIGVGCTVVASGFSSINTDHIVGDTDPDSRIRVRDRAEVYNPDYVPYTPDYEPAEPKPVAPKPDAPAVVVKQEATVGKDGTSASAAISNQALNAAVKSAKQSGSTEIILSATLPKTGSDKVVALTVALPASALSSVAANKNLDLTVATPYGSVTFGNAAVKALAGQSNPSVGTSITGKDVTFTVSAAGKPIETLKGGFIATIPAEKVSAGSVLLLVNPDGSTTLVTKCIASKDGMKCLLTGNATLRVADNTKVFNDVPADHWGSSSVAFVASRGMLQGTGEKQFSPEANTSRGMLITALYRLEGSPAVKGAAPADVAKDSWYAKSAAWAKELGISNNEKLEGDREISRQELVTMAYRYAKVMKLDLTPSAKLDGYSDSGKVADWAKDAMSWAVAIGLVKGLPGGKLAPDDLASRAQISAIMERLVIYMVP